MPTRDRPELLQRAVNAIYGQDYEGHIECIVVFDQSDVVPPLVPSRSNRSLKTIANTRTPGLAGARNSGVEAATGDLLSFCDDDDLWRPTKTRRQVPELLAHPEASLVSCGIEIHYGKRRFKRNPGSDWITFYDLLRSRVMELAPATFLLHRERFVDQIGFVDERLPGSYAEDYEWLLRATHFGPIKVIREPLVEILWHPTSSWFAGRWETIASALTYLLEQHPEFHEEPRGLARLYGQIAFAHAARGSPTQARRWGAKCLRTDWRQVRGYLAFLVMLGLLRPEHLRRIAHAFGRGIG